MLATLRHDARRQPRFVALRHNNARMKTPAERILASGNEPLVMMSANLTYVTVNPSVSDQAMAEDSNQPERPR
jgi:hypothetical protein